MHDPNAIDKLHLTLVIPWVSHSRPYRPRRP
jgi:hypothetical protein